MIQSYIQGDKVSPELNNCLVPEHLEIFLSMQPVKISLDYIFKHVVYRMISEDQRNNFTFFAASLFFY